MHAQRFGDSSVVVTWSLRENSSTCSLRIDWLDANARVIEMRNIWIDVFAKECRNDCVACSPALNARAAIRVRGIFYDYRKL